MQILGNPEAEAELLLFGKTAAGKKDALL